MASLSELSRIAAPRTGGAEPGERKRRRVDEAHSTSIQGRSSIHGNVCCHGTSQRRIRWPAGERCDGCVSEGDIVACEGRCRGRIARRPSALPSRGSSSRVVTRETPRTEYRTPSPSHMASPNESVDDASDATNVVLHRPAFHRARVGAPFAELRSKPRPRSSSTKAIAGRHFILGADSAFQGARSTSGNSARTPVAPRATSTSRAPCAIVSSVYATPAFSRCSNSVSKR